MLDLDVGLTSFPSVHIEIVLNSLPLYCDVLRSGL
jgi:hypothetical protein